MQMTRSRKILGTAEVVAAVVVLVLAVVLAPAYTGEQPAETAPATEATEAATADHPYRIRNLRVRSLSKRASSRFHAAHTSASLTASFCRTFCNSSCPA